MKDRPFVGVWLDHRGAWLFWANEQAEIQTQRVESEYQEENEPTDLAPGGNPYTYGAAVTHASVERRRKQQLHHYYKKLDEVLRPARHIFLFGPGQAKRELMRVLEEDKNLRGRVQAVENADKKVTQAQMAARVREFFKLRRAGA